jgi:hypothetical protein
MGTIASHRVLIDAVASDLAFHAGQRVEMMLLERGEELARESGSSVITADDVLASISSNLLDQLRNELYERAKRDCQKAA